jgi:hypothetical protein
MRRFVVPLVIAAPLLIVLAAGTPRAAQRPSGPQGTLKMTITTGGGLFGPPKESYRAGQRIPVAISMTNSGDQPVYVCDTSTLYQDRPRLLKDGKPLPYEAVQEKMMESSLKDKTCKNIDEDLDDFMDQRLLKPGETAVVDWFILTEGETAQGDMAWYGSLGPGRYELSTRRQLGCCEGRWVESDKIGFEVVP